MPRVIEKVAAIAHLADGRTEEGYFRVPIRVPVGEGGQFYTMYKDDGVEVLINLNQIISIDQKVIYRE